MKMRFVSREFLETRFYDVKQLVVKTHIDESYGIGYKIWDYMQVPSMLKVNQSHVGRRVIVAEDRNREYRLVEYNQKNTEGWKDGGVVVNRLPSKKPVIQLIESVILNPEDLQ